MLEPPKFIENDCYNGSRTFTWLADMVGLSVDLVSNTPNLDSLVLKTPPPLPLSFETGVCTCACVYACQFVCQSYGIKAAEQISLFLRTMHFLKDRAGIYFCLNGIFFRELCKTYLATGGKQIPCRLPKQRFSLQ